MKINYLKESKALFLLFFTTVFLIFNSDLFHLFHIFAKNFFAYWLTYILSSVLKMSQVAKSAKRMGSFLGFEKEN